MNNESRLDAWCRAVAAVKAELNRVLSDEGPRWAATGEESDRPRAEITPEKDLIFFDDDAIVRITLDEASALSLAQFIVNWYTPKPVSIL